MPPDVVTFDTETGLSQPYRQVPDLACISIDGPQTPGVLVDRDARGWAEWILSQPSISNHFIAYDMAQLVNRWPDLWPAVVRAYDENRVTDTGIREKLWKLANGELTFWDKSKGWALDTLCLDRMGVTVAKGDDTWRLHYGSLIGTPIEHWPDAAREYAINDACVTRQLWLAQEREIPAMVLQDQHRQARAEFWLYLCRAWGLTIDQREVDRLEAAIVGEHAQCAEILRAAGILRPDGSRDTKRAAAEVERAVGDPDKVERTPTGLVALGNEVCSKIDDPVVRAYGRFGELNTVITKDIPMLRREIIHARYESLKETGRTSTRGPNVQNWKVLRYGEDKAKGLPGVGIRECCVPRPGWIYVSADFGGLELATWAQACLDILGHSRLAEFLNARRDPHLEIASQILGRPYDELVPLKKEKDVHLARQTGKVCNFGFPGGLGPRSCVDFAWSNYKVKLTLEQATELKAIWRRTYPEADPYFQWVHRQIGGRRGYITQFRSNRIRGGCSFTEAANSLFQGPGSDIAKDAGWRITRACYAEPSSPLYGSRMVVFVHDEFILETPDDPVRRAAAGEELSRIMGATARDWLPDVYLGAEPQLHYIWSKAVETVRDAQGTLIPWQQSL